MGFGPCSARLMSLVPITCVFVGRFFIDDDGDLFDVDDNDEESNLIRATIRKDESSVTSSEVEELQQIAKQIEHRYAYPSRMGTTHESDEKNIPLWELGVPVSDKKREQTLMGLIFYKARPGKRIRSSLATFSNYHPGSEQVESQIETV